MTLGVFPQPPTGWSIPGLQHQSFHVRSQRSFAFRSYCRVLPAEIYVIHPPSPRYWLHILLFAGDDFHHAGGGREDGIRFPPQRSARLFTVTNIIPLFPVGWAFGEPSRLLLGIPFSATLLLILLAHEMGHYLYCRYYGVYATLPFFIPAPTLIGTLGAVIRIRSPIRSRCALFDIGIAGPIAGFVVALTVLVIAMNHSRVMPGVMANSDIEMGYPLIFHLLWTVLPLGRRAWRIIDAAGYLFSSHGDCRLGGNVCDCAESVCPADNSTAATLFSR